MQGKFLSNLIILIALNLLVKPLAIFGIDATIQNRVGAEEYGLFVSLLNFTFLFNVLLDIGINNFTTKNVAQHAQMMPKYFGKVLGIRVLLFILYSVVTFSVGWLLNYSPRQMNLVFILILCQFFITMIAYARSHLAGLLYFKTDALLSVLDRTLLILFAGWVLFFSSDHFTLSVETYAWILAACYAIAMSIAMVILISKIGAPKIKIHLPFTRVMLRKSFPYALLIFLMMIYTRTDSVMLERMHVDGKTEAGIYAQGFRLLDALFMFAMLFSNILFPLFSYMLKQKDEGIRQLLQLASKLLVLGGAAIAVLAIFNADQLLGWIYVNEIQASVLPFQLLMATFIGMCTTLIFGTLLTANGSMKVLNWVSFIGLILNIGINTYLIPTYGAVGAAIATVITQSLIGIIQAIYVYQLFEFKINGKRVVLNMAYLLLLITSLYFLNEYSVNLGVQFAVVIGLLFGFRIIDLKEVKMLLLKKQPAEV